MGLKPYELNSFFLFKSFFIDLIQGDFSDLNLCMSGTSLIFVQKLQRQDNNLGSWRNTYNDCSL